MRPPPYPAASGVDRSRQIPRAFEDLERDGTGQREAGDHPERRAQAEQAAFHHERAQGGAGQPAKPHKALWMPMYAGSSGPVRTP